MKIWQINNVVLLISSIIMNISPILFIKNLSNIKGFLLCSQREYILHKRLAKLQS